MADQWPSEDEDFDAIMDAQPARPTALASRRPARSNATPISVRDTETESEPDQKQKPAEEVVTSQAILEAAPDPVVYQEPVVDQQSEPEESVSSEDETPQQTDTDKEPEIDPLHEAGVVPPSVHKPSQSASSGNRKVVIGHIVFEVLLVVVIAALALYANNLQSEQTDLKNQVAKLNNDPTLVAKRESDNIIQKVAALMQLPAGETPTIANVSDATKAKEQSEFFKDAQNDDKVLMYVNAKQAILYRPSTNKIVLVAPLTLTNEQAAATNSAKATTTTPKTTR